MSAVSESQRRAAGAALSAKRGERSVRSLRGASSSMYRSMTVSQLRDFAGKPVKKRKKRRAQR